MVSDDAPYHDGPMIRFATPHDAFATRARASRLRLVALLLLPLSLAGRPTSADPETRRAVLQRISRQEHIEIAVSECDAVIIGDFGGFRDTLVQFTPGMEPSIPRTDVILSVRKVLKGEVPEATIRAVFTSFGPTRDQMIASLQHTHRRVVAFLQHFPGRWVLDSMDGPNGGLLPLTGETEDAMAASVERAVSSQTLSVLATSAPLVVIGHIVGAPHCPEIMPTTCYAFAVDSTVFGTPPTSTELIVNTRLPLLKSFKRALLFLKPGMPGTDTYDLVGNHAGVVPTTDLHDQPTRPLDALLGGLKALRYPAVEGK